MHSGTSHILLTLHSVVVQTKPFVESDNTKIVLSIQNIDGCYYLKRNIHMEHVGAGGLAGCCFVKSCTSVKEAAKPRQSERRQQRTTRCSPTKHQEVGKRPEESCESFHSKFQLKAFWRYEQRKKLSHIVWFLYVQEDRTFNIFCK